MSKREDLNAFRGKGIRKGAFLWVKFASLVDEKNAAYRKKPEIE